MSEFWLNNPHVLYKNNNYIIFFPTVQMSRTEQLNSIARFAIYALFVLLLFSKNKDWIILPLFLLILTIVLNKVNKEDEYGEKKEFAKERRFKNQDIKQQLENNINAPINEENLDNLLYPDRTCRKPTIDNPYMNPPVTDYNADKFDLPVACNSFDEEINNEIYDKFGHNLYRDMSQLWSRGNVDRQFYHLAYMDVPNDQKTFAEWLYKNNPSCKQDTDRCGQLNLLHRDLRYNRR